MYIELSIILIGNTTTNNESNIRHLYNHYIGKFSTFHAWHHFTVYLSGAGIFIRRNYNDLNKQESFKNRYYIL